MISVLVIPVPLSLTAGRGVLPVSLEGPHSLCWLSTLTAGACCASGFPHRHVSQLGSDSFSAATWRAGTNSRVSSL